MSELENRLKELRHQIAWAMVIGCPIIFYLIWVSTVIIVAIY